MRKLSDTFMATLTDGFLSPLRERVVCDKDLDLQIREDYLSIYYKGNSLVRLSEGSGKRFRAAIHPKFRADLEIDDLTNEKTTKEFLVRIPTIKENIIQHGASSLEAEYEQLLIRANNNEDKNASEYFIVDRQLTLPGQDRIDLTAVFWDRNGRRRSQTVPLCFIEIKFALNTDIKDVHRQLERYHDIVNEYADEITDEAEIVFHQKLALGLYDQPANRIEAMKTLTIDRKPKSFQFILAMVDYNPYSRRLDLDLLRQLPFADQLWIFMGGFAMWKPRSETVQLSEIHTVRQIKES
jgi:hypothetical protein